MVHDSARFGTGWLFASRLISGLNSPPQPKMNWGPGYGNVVTIDRGEPIMSVPPRLACAGATGVGRLVCLGDEGANGPHAPARPAPASPPTTRLTNAPP